MSTLIHHRLLSVRSGCKSIGAPIGGKGYNANTFIADNEQRTRSVLKTNVYGLGTNAFGAGDERVYRCRRRRLALERKRLALHGNERRGGSVRGSVADPEICKGGVLFAY